MVSQSTLAQLPLASGQIWFGSHFGVKPEMVLLGGSIAVAQMGDLNASIPTPQPVLYAHVCWPWRFC